MSDSFINSMVDNLAGPKSQGDFTKGITSAGLGKVEDGALTLDPKMLAKTIEKMTLGQLKGFAQDLGKTAGKMELTNMEGIQKQLMLKMTEKAEAKADNSLIGQVGDMINNVNKSEQLTAMAPAAASPSRTDLAEQAAP